MAEVGTSFEIVTGDDELRRRVAELEALARVATAVDRSEGLDDVFAVALDELIAGTDATRASVLLFDAAGVMRFRAWRGLSEAYRAAVDGHSPWTPDERDAHPLTVPDVARDESLGELRDVILGERIRALAFVPLLHRGRLVGKFMLYHDRRHVFREDELRFAQTIGSHVAAASERRRVEDAVLASRADLEAILAEVADGITVQDPSGALVYANDAAARLIGFDSAEELMATPIADVLERFDMFDEHGEPFSVERLPGRLALTGVAAEQVVCYRVRESGARRWSIVRATPIFDGDDSIRFAVNSFQEITERKQAEERLRLLADASSLLEALDVEATLAQIPKLVVPRLADACSVWFADDGFLHRLATYTEDPDKRVAYESIPERFSLTEDADTLMVGLFNAGEPVLMANLTQEKLRTAARDERDIDAVDRVGTRSAIVHPLVARGRNFGLLSLISFEPGRFGEDDLAITRGLAERVALALDRAFLYRESQQARRDLAFLAESGALFASSLDRDEILRRISRVAVPRVADACNIFLADGDILTRVAHAHVDPDLERVMDAMPNRYAIGPDAPAVFRRMLLNGEPLLASTLEPPLIEALERIGLDRHAFERVGSRSMMFVPFVARGETVGLMTLGARRPGQYRERDLELALELARRAAVAIENARFYERAQARAHASQALEFVGDGVVLVDRADVVRLWNPAAVAITGLGAGQVVGRDAADAIVGWAALKPHVPIGQRPETLPLELADRELWLSISGVDFGEGTVYAFRDVTEERGVERMKTDFISTVSHELRTPLAAIYGAALTVRRNDRSIDSRREELIALIASESERLARTIDDVLWASKLESGTLDVAIRSCDPTELLELVVSAHRTHLPENLELELQAAPDLPQVAADPDKVRQALENLLDNAVKYSPDGGVIRVAAERAGRQLRFVVADEGLGVPPGERERIFSKFYRLDPDLTRGVGGTGLGLYICRALVQRMGGHVWVDSNGVSGSTFVIELPLASSGETG